MLVLVLILDTKVLVLDEHWLIFWPVTEIGHVTVKTFEKSVGKE